MTRADRDALIAQVTTAHRERSARGTIEPHRAWFDLDDEARVEAFDETVHVRALEAALDPRGLTSTARAVLGRIGRTGP